MGASTKGRRPLLELEPDLGQLLDEPRRALAARELLVRVISIDVGEWSPNGLAQADPRHLGLLVMDGVLARHVTIEDTVSSELLGVGDIVRLWALQEPPELLPVHTNWNALSPVRLALLDARLSADLGRYPEITALIVDRLAARSQRLAITQAISQMTRVDDRLIALFWHLAERWGRVTSDGIAVPLALSHQLVAEFIGARRPTVSTAMSKLARDGQLTRRPDGTYLLTGKPLTASAAAAAEVIRQRRRLIREPAATDREPQPVNPSHPTLQSLAAMRAALEERRRQSEALIADTAELLDKLSETRARRPNAGDRGSPVAA